MKLTKYGHACVFIEEQGSKLIIDPGVYTKLPEDLSNVEAIVVTHEHADHFSPDNLAATFAQSPQSLQLTLPEIAAKMPDHKSRTIRPGDKADVGPFSLEFGGGLHAEIHPEIPRINNLAVTVNGKVYYPGDSYDLPGGNPDVVLMPINAPWAKIAETIEFYKVLKSKLVIPTHDALLSNEGHGVYDVSQRAAGSEYRRLKSGESIEI